MARSAALNPASMPFFPGGLRGGDEEGGSGLGFRHHAFRDQDRNSMSSLSISPSEYRSARSSPSPPVDNRDAARHKPSPDLNEWSRQSPTIRQVDAGRTHPGIENRTGREASMMGSLDTLPEGDDSQETPGPASGGTGTQTPGASFFSLQQRSRDRISTPPVAVVQSNTSFYGIPTSASPVSSLDSGSQFTSSGDHPTQNFEAQLKASPMMHDILSRLVQCEYSTREIQRDLGEINHKVNILLERTMGAPAQPEFKDPFASAKSNGHSFSSPPLNGPRPSLGNIAPNQPAPSDDITSISQRLNTLTSSVGQLLAIQTQHIQSTNTDMRSNSVVGLGSHHVDVAPNQTMPHVMSNSMALGHGLPQRPDIRQSIRHPNPPMRTWSAGTLDLPVRASDPNIGRQDNMVRDKRRSVTGLLRRESSGVRLNLLIHRLPLTLFTVSGFPS